MHKIRCIMGPTASGKTDLILSLAKNLPIEVISVDSAMVYREMNLGTAKPTSDELNICPHYLLDILNPNQIYSAAQFVADANKAIETITQRGNIPVLVGGTMLYFYALQCGLSVLPPADNTIRREIEHLAHEKGWPAVHTILQQIDPITAARIQPQDSQRLCRALEVFRLTGTPISTLQANQVVSKPYQFINCLLFPSSREWLHERIKHRFEHMIKQGLIAEVEKILAKWPDSREAPAMRAVGYRQVVMYLEGKLSYDAMIEKGIIATRQLAKRQCTWLRSWESGEMIDPQNTKSLDEVKHLFGFLSGKK